MATIEMERPHTLGDQAAKSKAEELARDMEEKLGIVWHWDGDRVRFKAESGMAKGTTGVVVVSADKVRVEIDLPFMLKAMKGMIEGKIHSKLDRLMG